MKKVVITGIVVFIVVFLVVDGYFIYKKIDTNRKVKEVNIGRLKYLKCMTYCPVPFKVSMSPEIETVYIDGEEFHLGCKKFLSEDIEKVLELEN